MSNSEKITEKNCPSRGQLALVIKAHVFRAARGERPRGAEIKRRGTQGRPSRNDTREHGPRLEARTAVAALA